MLNFLKIKNYSIKSQLILFLGVLTLPFIVMGVLTYRYSMDAMINILTENRVAVLEKTAQNMDQDLRNVVYAAYQIKFDENVQKVLSGNFGSKFNEIQKKINSNKAVSEADWKKYSDAQFQVKYPAQKDIGKFTNNINDIVSVYVVSLKQRLVNSSNIFLNLEDTKNYPWYQKMDKNSDQNFWISARMNENKLNTSDYVITYVSTIQDSLLMKKVFGHILFTLRADSLGNFVSPEEIGKEEKIYLLDKNFKVYYRSDGMYNKTDDIKNYVTSDYMKGYKSYYFTGTGNSKKLVTFVDIPSNNWRLVDVVPVSTLSNELNGLTRLIYFVVIMCISISLILSFLLYRAITRPLNEIVTRMKNIAYGDFSPQGYNVDTRNEVEKVHNNFNWMAKRVAQLMEKNIQVTAQKRDAELKALQSQINPHFLYNTLDAINWMAMLNKQDDISEMIKNLSRFFRYGLSDGKEIITIEEEIKHVEAFLEIEKFRYKNRFKVYFNLDKRLLQHKTLKFILQPFVENAFVHGFKETNGEGIIRIQLFSNEDNIYFEVIDDGVGMEPDLINKVLKEKSEGYGIKNVDERIKLKYGIQYGITIYSRLGEGTNVTIAIPKNPPSEEENSLIL